MLRQRIITAVIIAPIALACVFLLPPFEFSLFVGAILVVGAWEWANFAGLQPLLKYLYAGVIGIAMYASTFLPVQPILYASAFWWLLALVLVISYPKLDKFWGNMPVIMALGIIVLVPGFTALTELKQFPHSSYLICLLFFLIWGADIGAYFSGRAFGKAKLAPRVSPGKSWAGFVGGVITSVAIAVAMSYWLGRPPLTELSGVVFLAGCAGIAMVSVLGDLSISMFKRHRDLKDSSNLLPGHGGFLDRIDSLLSASPVFVLYLLWADWL